MAGLDHPQARILFQPFTGVSGAAERLVLRIASRVTVKDRLVVRIVRTELSDNTALDVQAGTSKASFAADKERRLGYRAFGATWFSGVNSYGAPVPDDPRNSLRPSGNVRSLPFALLDPSFA